MERSTKKNGLLNFLVLLLVGGAAFAVARATNSLAGQISAAFIGLGVLVAAVSWFQMRLEENEQLERLELDELAKSKGSSTLFEGKDSEVFPAQRSREQFERFFVPGFTALLFIVEGLGAFLLWRWLNGSEIAAEVKQPTIALALFGLFALILFLLGKFSATIARLEDHRLLRPSAGWVLMSAYLCFIVALGIIGVGTDSSRQSGFFKTDLYVARGLAVLLGLVAFETLINLILEIYRPHVKGKVARPLYESRVVGLLGQPEGVFTTAAKTLDYQFGFKVSETWFYRFFEKALAWLLLLQLGVLLASTCVIFIEPGEQGLLERFGKPVESRTLLNPGVHLKWPWPIDRVYRYQTEQIQSFNVGYTPSPEFENQPALLWTMAHPNEENFLVANREQLTTTNAVSGRRAPPVSLLTVSIPVQFQITNLLDWAYRNQEPTNLLRNIATREAVRYFVNADLNDVMSRDRLEASETLRSRIQAIASEQQLGAKILFVGLQDIHPPVKVAPDYEKVVGAEHQKQAKILAAEAEAIQTNALAQADATNMINQATGERVNREISAFAQAALFTNQIPAFEAAPSVYMQRAYLQTFARGTAKTRKYVILSTNTDNVFVIDLQDKISFDMLEGDKALRVTPEK
ncbi:MAG TPA: protease modulator HflK [Candidatus Paceibacterota bacterium]|nr:protease modulator HflK [Candidatus Paceibacterota bacterium]